MNDKMNMPKIILEHRKKNKHIMESRKNLPKKSLSEIAEAFGKLHEELETMLRGNRENK